MSSCLDCKFADWKRTAAGKLHPSGDGRCKHVWTPPPVSAAHWFYDTKSRTPPNPTWGHITRKEPFRTDGVDGCKVFQRKLPHE